ncbi:splicing factor 3a [Trypanosoma brucei equiperdum]|uniref:Splicing factor 3a n=1 Tax=Trypanosoma brucei equiperdum TaxID=630700 RepID=A0A3L6L670_9TRYP|nr:splicing factor 3a [Trypanosoma brucei equiperdum]
MFGGVLEKIRLFEADIERHIDSIVQQLLIEDISNKRHQLLRDYFIIQQAEAVEPIAEKLLDIYLDQDDIVSAQEAPAEGEAVYSNALKEFEARIADIREYHRTFRDVPTVKCELDLPDVNALDNVFTLAERYGSCLDLEAHYHRYSNFMLSTSKRALETNHTVGTAWPGRVEYLTFVTSVINIILNDVDPYRKVYGFWSYKEFVEELLKYLVHFHKRVLVMESDVLESTLTKCDADAEEFWSKLVEHKKSVVTISSTAVALPGTAGKSVSSLHAPAPLRRYVKAFALWPITYVESVTPSEIEKPPSLEEVKAVVHIEAKIVVLLQTLLFEHLQETEKILLRDYSKTVEELEWERDNMQAEFLRSVEEAKKRCATTVEGSVVQAAQHEVAVAFAPEEGKEVPTANGVLAPGTKAGDTNDQLLDSDGKPVARWLVCLQQLHKRFYCEVCGGTVYIGPKVFKDHFGAERHAEGLRRLGVTLHLKNYEGISSIRKVIEMRDKVMGNSRSLRKRIHADQEDEEMQDAQGNVITAGAYRKFQMSRKTG